MLLVEHYVHIGDGRVPLSLAQRAADELLVSQGENGDEPVQLPTDPMAAENDAALADLMSRMGNIG